MADSIRLHQKHCLAPAMLICPVCGNTTGIALLGADADRIMKQVGQDGYQEHGHNNVPDRNICEECQSLLNNKGIIILAEDTHQSLRLNEEAISVMKEKLGEIIKFDDFRGQIVRMKKAFWYTSGDNICLRDPKEWINQ